MFSMKYKKVGILLISSLIFISLICLASAIDLNITKETLNNVIVTDFDNEAVFKFTIKNLGETDSFEIYSLIGVDMTPKGAFLLESGQTKTFTVRVKADESVKKNLGYYSFSYKIKSANFGIQEDRLTIRLVNLKGSLQLFADNINPDSDQAVVHMQNQERFDFENIEADFSSVFFNFKKDFSLEALEKKSFTVDLKKEELSTLMAGVYLLNVNIKINEVQETLSSTIKFLEKSGLSTKETKEGILISRHEIEKKNEGNLITLAEIAIQKNIISRLFTNFNLQPNKIERAGSNIIYSWQQELKPDESLKVIIRTNYLIPIIIMIAIVILVFLLRVYLVSDIRLKKKINFVKTKGGEFALKVSINVKAKKFVEKINIIDKLPPIVKLYERYGTITPDKIDEKNRRIEWNIESLDKEEESVLSYIIYSKIGIIGRFELPPAKAFYEKEGEIKETQSNKVIFVSEPRKLKKKKHIEQVEQE